MLYLKKFNENISDDEYNRIKVFCEEYLSYLLDDDNIELEIYNDKTSIDISIRFIDTWIYLSNITYILIPFFEFLKDEYEIIPFDISYLGYNKKNVNILDKKSILYICDINGQNDYYNIDDIVNNKFNDCIIHSLEFSIRNKDGNLKKIQ